MKTSRERSRPDTPGGFQRISGSDETGETKVPATRRAAAAARQDLYRKHADSAVLRTIPLFASRLLTKDSQSLSDEPIMIECLRVLSNEKVTHDVPHSNIYSLKFASESRGSAAPIGRKRRREPRGSAPRRRSPARKRRSSRAQTRSRRIAAATRSSRLCRRQTGEQLKTAADVAPPAGGTRNAGGEAAARESRTSRESRGERRSVIAAPTFAERANAGSSTLRPSDSKKATRRRGDERSGRMRRDRICHKKPRWLRKDDRRPSDVTNANRLRAIAAV